MKRTHRTKGRGRILVAVVWVAGTLSQLLGSASITSAGPEPGELVAFEESVRADTDWAARSRESRGPDPYRLIAAPTRDRWVGLLRGDDAVVVLDQTGREVSRAPTPPSPTGLTFAPGGDLLVVGEQSGRLARFRLQDDRLTPICSPRVPGAYALRDIGVVGNQVIAVDAYLHRVVAIDPHGEATETRTLAACEGPVGLTIIDDLAVVNCLLEGALLVLDDTGREITRIVHDGPFWSLAGKKTAEGLLLAAGGVEDRPLDRSDGAFGYIDSFLFLYRVDPASGDVTRLSSENLSSHGIVTPKAIAFTGDTNSSVRVAGFATPDLLTLTWADPKFADTPIVTRQNLPPGTTDLEGPLAANPLLDAWIVIERPDAPVVVHPTSTRSPESRIGEALFFTTLLAPWNGSEGPRSRFTCETCHHEGYVDGRTHSTGRGNVRATTKPLVGLHGNRPYFSRALDPTMARMVHNEFRVANKKNGRDPWFSISRADFPWLDAAATPERMSPVFLRRALMTFLIGFEHAPNPAAAHRSTFTDAERRGAAVFAERCQGCHAARLVTDEPSSAVPPAGWEENLFASGSIVWGRDGYEKTGITPYVHPKGARPPSLRRIYKKRPFFTNGSAADLDAVLAGITSTGLPHSAEGKGTLSPEERTDLRAFLDLL